LVRFLAYIDPSSGSFVLQAAVGTIMGVSFAFRNRMRVIMTKLSKKAMRAQQPNDSE